MLICLWLGTCRAVRQACSPARALERRGERPSLMLASQGDQAAEAAQAARGSKRGHQGQVRGRCQCPPPAQGGGVAARSSSCSLNLGAREWLLAFWKLSESEWLLPGSKGCLSGGNCPPDIRGQAAPLSGGKRLTPGGFLPGNKWLQFWKLFGDDSSLEASGWRKGAEPLWGRLAPRQGQAPPLSGKSHASASGVEWLLSRNFLRQVAAFWGQALATRSSSHLSGGDWRLAGGKQPRCLSLHKGQVASHATSPHSLLENKWLLSGNFLEMSGCFLEAFWK